MPGSSRSLIRAINAVFDSWEDTEDSTLNSETREAIEQFLLKHNTLQIINQSTSINNELFRIYNTYIKTSHSLSKELLFLELLKELVSVLKKSEVELWLKTYLKPSLDSASVDIKFVESSREFLKSTLNISSSGDVELFEYRLDITQLTIELIFQAYVGSNHSELLDLKERDIDTQVYQERIRFIKLNCWKLLLEYGQNHTKDYFCFLNSHIVNPNERLESLSLLSALVSEGDDHDATLSMEGRNSPDATLHEASPIEAPDVQTTTSYLKSRRKLFTVESSPIAEIMATKLFKSLLNCLIYDSNEHILQTALAVATMLIPHICSGISRYIADLFYAFARIVQLPEMEFPKEKSEWKPYITSTKSVKSLKWIHFGTLLYGLYPVNLTKFMKSPLRYLQKYPPILVKTRAVPMSEAPLVSSFEDFLRDLIIHPRFIYFDKQTELEDPLEWMDLDHGTDIREISLECFELNTKLSVNLDNSYSSLSAFQTPINNRSFNSASEHLSSRKSSDIVYFHARDSLNKAAATRRSTFEEIKFKDVKFAGGAEDDVDLNEPMNDLFSTHEILFGPKHRESSVSLSLAAPLGDIRRNSSIVDNSLVLSNQISSPTTSVETAFSHKESVGTKSVGTALNFFQREILLLKNEVEFSNYMTDLNKYKYLRSLMSNRETSKTVELQNTSVKLENLAETYQLAKDEVKVLQSQAERRKQEESDLVERFLGLKTERDELIHKYDQLVSEHTQINSTLNRIYKEIIPSKDFEINNLKLKLTDVETNQQTVSLAKATSNPNANAQLEQLEEVTDQEKKEFKLQTQILSLKEKNAQLLAQLKQARDLQDILEQKYNSKLELSKLDLNNNLDLQNVQYERKIQELSVTIVKFENLLEEKNAQLVQLSCSKPISIPNAYSRTPTGTRRDENYDNDRSNSSVDSISSAHNPVHVQRPPAQAPQFVNLNYPQQPVRTNSVVSNVNATQQPPIIRGRGGYQKRSKKLM